MNKITSSLFIISTICLAGIGMYSCGSKTKEVKTMGAPGKAGMPAPVVDGFIVQHVPVTDNLSLPGTLIANESTEIHPEIAGRLTYLNVNEGRTVGKGALIARIYDGDLQAQLNKLNIQLRVANETAKRYEALLKINGVSQQEYDLQGLAISNIRADMEIVRSNIQRTKVFAPFSGTLGLKNISPGAYVTPQTVITTLRQNSQLKLDFTLPEKYTGKISNGQLLNFTAEGNSKTYAARVIATEAAVTENNRSLNVRAQVTNNDGKLLPGTFIKVATQFDPDPNAIMIPSQAIIPQARGKQVAVYRGGTASYENVTTGIRDEAMVQITEGLKVGDTIITSGLMSLKPGGKVALKPIK
ncbi:MAG: efflux RND transporter periplasmic adaptor subunit [Ferruginibacter sp.]